MRLETERLVITEFDLSMSESVHRNSLDDDTRRFIPDEVFETIEAAEETLEFLMGVYASGDGPLVYPVLLKDGTNIGYVQLIPIKEGFEIGYHIGKPYTRNGYATEAVNAFLKHITTCRNVDVVYGICVSENTASKHVLEKCSFQKEYEGMGEYQGTRKQIVRYIFKYQAKRE